MKFIGMIACASVAIDCIERAIGATPSVLPFPWWAWWFIAAGWAYWAWEFAVSKHGDAA
jgi:hypothetical protein